MLNYPMTEAEEKYNKLYETEDFRNLGAFGAYCLWDEGGAIPWDALKAAVIPL